MRTHAAMPPPGGRHGVDPLHPGWRPEHPPAAPHGPGPRTSPDYPPPSGYHTPVDYRRPPQPSAAPAQPAHAVAPSHSDMPADQPAQDEERASAQARRWADLRLQVAYRCRRLNTGHMVEADQRYGTREALGPHGLMLFFVSDAPAEPHGYLLHTAYRLWLASPESENLPRLLTDLAEVVRDNVARAASAHHRWHPLGPDASMVNGGDMSLPPRATYVGVGVSTLDSEQGRWHQVARTLRDGSGGRYLSAFDLKGQCYVVLTDGTALHLDRDPHARIGADGISCTHTLDPDRPAYWHNPHANLTEQGDDATREVWRRLGVLHHTLTAHLLRRSA